MLRSTCYRQCKTAFAVRLRVSSPAVAIRNKVLFESATAGACTVFSNESFASSDQLHARAVWLELNKGTGWFGLLPATPTEPCASHRLGTCGLPGSVACRVGNDRVAVVFNDKELMSMAHECTTPLLLDVTVTDGVAAFHVGGKSLPCPALKELKLTGDLRVGFSTGDARQCGTVSLERGQAVRGLSQEPQSEEAATKERLREAVEKMQKQLQGPPGEGSEQAKSGNLAEQGNENVDPDAGLLYTDPDWLQFGVNKHGAIAALTPTAFRCNAPQGGTVYVPVPVDTGANATLGVSVRFSGVSKGYVGCGFFKKEALEATDVSACLVGKTQHSIGCLLKNGQVFVLVDDKPVHSGLTCKADELTMHFSFDRNKGTMVRVDSGDVNCAELQDMSLLSGDLYFGISMSEEGQVARILPSGLGTLRCHYSEESVDLEVLNELECSHSHRGSLSANERWYGNAEACFVMRVGDVYCEPIGVGLVSANLWCKSPDTMVGEKAFGPHSIGLLLKDRRIYVHFQDEFIEWKPLRKMPPLPNNADLMMRVSGGKISFFYQGIPVNLPVIADLTLPADEQFRAAYTMSDKGQTAVIPLNLPVRAPDNVKQRCSFVGDAKHVKLTESNRTARAVVPSALCFSSEAFAITTCAWDSYSQGCSGCERTASSPFALRGTLWLCSKCGSPDEFALCDACYWNENASKHDHDRNTFIPLFGAGLNEMRLLVDDAKDSYLEVGVAPASYREGFGTVGKHTTVLLGNVSDLVKAAMPAEKIASSCPALVKGDEICLRVDGADMTVLVNDKAVFQTTLSAEDDPFMKQPLRFGVRMSQFGQRLRVTTVETV